MKDKHRYDLYMKGHTYGEIAAMENHGKIGGHVSRNSIAGSVYRYRLARGLSATLDRMPKQLKKKSRRKMEPVKTVEITPFHFTLAQLSHDECRFPYGDEQYTFCGHKRAPGSSYCPTHQALCGRKVPKKSGVLDSIAFEPWKSAKACEASRRARRT